MNIQTEAEELGKLILEHTLEYLKGRDVPLMGTWTSEVVGDVDDCQICHGEEGGELGNENIINGVIVCDYCSAAIMSGLIDSPTWNGEGPTPYVHQPRKEQELIQIKAAPDEEV